MRQSVLMLAAVLLLVLIAPGSVRAETDTLVPFPTIPKANDKPDFHGDEEIRKTHMRNLMHQRDETMRQGIRPEEDSLKACMSCHAVKDDAGIAVSYDNPEHFCRVCHDYTAVKVDCFSCHASTPGKGYRMTTVSGKVAQ